MASATRTEGIEYLHLRAGVTQAILISIPQSIAGKPVPLTLGRLQKIIDFSQHALYQEPTRSSLFAVQHLFVLKMLVIAIPLPAV